MRLALPAGWVLFSGKNSITEIIGKVASKMSRSFVISVLAFLSVASSMVIPTWGAKLGHAGNWIPVLVSAGPLLLASAIILIRGVEVIGIMRGLLFTFWLALPVLALSGTILSPYSPSLDGYSDFLRFFIVGCALLVGYYLAVEAPAAGARVLFYSISISVVLNVLLFGLFWLDPWNSMAQLYSTRTMGGTKFPGAWNYPYNLTVFLALALAMYYVAFFFVRDVRLKVGVFLMGLVCVFMIVAAQSRAGLLALFAAAIVTPVVLSFFDLVSNRGGAFVRKLALIGFLGVALVGLGYYLVFVSDLVWVRYYQRLQGLTWESDPRAQQFMLYLSELRDHPVAVLVGFGVSRDFPVWLENAAMYMQRFGAFGFFLIVLYPILVITNKAVACWRSDHSEYGPKILGGVLFFVFFFMINALTNNIVFHFRFMVVFFFAVGFVAGLQPSLIGSLVRRVGNGGRSDFIPRRLCRYDLRGPGGRVGGVR